MNRNWSAIVVAALGVVSALLSRLIGRSDKPAAPAQPTPQEVPPAPPPRADGQITAEAHARVDAAAGSNMKTIVVQWGGDDWTENYGRSFPADTADDAAVSSTLNDLLQKARAGEIKSGRVKSVAVYDAAGVDVDPEAPTVRP